MSLTPSQKSELAYRWSKEQWISIPVWRYIHLLVTAGFATIFIANHVYNFQEWEYLYNPTLYAFVSIIALGLVEFLGISLISIPMDIHNDKYEAYLSYGSCRSAVMTYIDMLIIVLHIAIALLGWQYGFIWIFIFPIVYLMSFAFYKQRQKSMIYEAIAKLL